MPITARDDIDRLGPWFHNLHLPDGTQTAPDHDFGDFPAFKWREIASHLPEDLEGWTALDIGCNAGFYSFELAKRGARVSGIDHDGHYLEQARWAAREMGLEDRVDFERRSVWDLAREERTWDLVLFMGVLYHLRYPLLGLDLVARRTERLMVFQTLTAPGEERFEDDGTHGLHDREVLDEAGWPRLAFFEHRFQDDLTNWWAPNAAAVEAMLRSTGLDVTGRPGHEIWLCRPAVGGGDFHSYEELRAATGGGGLGKDW